MHPELFRIPGVDWGVKSYGFMLMIGFLTAIWLAMRRAERVKANPDLILDLGFVALILGIVGARVFYVVHYWDSQFAVRSHPLWAAVNLTAGGLEYYGGLLSAIGGISLYLVIKRASWRLYMDILAPAAMWGLAFGRAGCFLNGCCWGGPCVDAHQQAALPWAIRFPYGSPAYVRQWEQRQVKPPAELICDSPELAEYPMLLPRDVLEMPPEERDGPIRTLEDLRDRLNKAKAADPESQETRDLQTEIDRYVKAHAQQLGKLEPLSHALQYPSRIDPTRRITVSELEDLAAQCRTLPVHPAQIYGIINALLLSFLLEQIFYRRKRHGMVFATMLLLYPISRVILEMIRVDNPHDTAGLTISQAVSLGTFLVGVALFVVMYRFLPIRSPRAVPFVAPTSKPKDASAAD